MAISNHQETVKQAAALLSETVSGISDLLTHPELQGLKRRIISQVNKANAHLQGAAGIYVPNANMQEVNEIISSFQPLDSVGGVPLNRIEPVHASALDIRQEERNEFLRKREDLYDRFLSMDSNEIHALTREPNGSILIRAVAKQAGLADYRERFIDNDFLDEVKELIAGQQEQNKAVAMAAGASALDDEEDEDLDDDQEDENVGKGAPNYSNLGKGGTPSGKPKGRK